MSDTDVSDEYAASVASVPNITGEWLMLQHLVLDSLGLKLDPKIGCRNWYLSRQPRKLSEFHFLPHPFELIIS
jgi:hypothetical protein